MRRLCFYTCLSFCPRGEYLGMYSSGTRYTPSDQVHPLAQVHPPYNQVHPLDQVHPPGSSAGWEISATSGRYTSYWNAFLFFLAMQTFYHCPQRSCGKVIFSQASVILFTGRRGVCLNACWDTTPPQTRQAPAPPGQAGTPSPEQIRAYWEIRSTSGRYASYWKAVLFFNMLTNICEHDAHDTRAVFEIQLMLSLFLKCHISIKTCLAKFARCYSFTDCP